MQPYLNLPDTLCRWWRISDTLWCWRICLPPCKDPLGRRILAQSCCIPCRYSYLGWRMFSDTESSWSRLGRRRKLQQQKIIHYISMLKLYKAKYFVHNSVFVHILYLYIYSTNNFIKIFGYCCQLLIPVAEYSLQFPLSQSFSSRRFVGQSGALRMIFLSLDTLPFPHGTAHSVQVDHWEISHTAVEKRKKELY